MAPAVAALRDAAAQVAVADPHLTLLCDADGAAATTGKEWLERIVAQVAAPVRWDLCMRTMADLGVTALIELPPAGTLTGLARRALPGVAQLAIKTPDQLAAARDLIDGAPVRARRARARPPAGVAADRGADLGYVPVPGRTFRRGGAPAPWSR